MTICRRCCQRYTYIETRKKGMFYQIRNNWNYSGFSENFELKLDYYKLYPFPFCASFYAVAVAATFIHLENLHLKCFIAEEINVHGRFFLLTVFTLKVVL